MLLDVASKYMMAHETDIAATMTTKFPTLALSYLYHARNQCFYCYGQYLCLWVLVDAEGGRLAIRIAVGVSS